MSAVYILARERYRNLLKIVSRWVREDIPVILVVEQEYYEIYRRFLRTNNLDVANVSISCPIRSNAGLGYVRSHVINNAYARGYQSIIMSDDDMIPVGKYSMRKLLKEAEEPGVLGIGATQRLHDHFTQGKLSKCSGVILCPGGWGMQLFALNVKQTIGIGNFDIYLDCFGEDHELMRQGIRDGIPWLVHCDVKAQPLGSRYAPGGVSSLYADPEERAARELQCRQRIHSLWPDYTSKPEERSRVAWSKMLDDYIPGWRARSDLHGGQWHA